MTRSIFAVFFALFAVFFTTSTATINTRQSSASNASTSVFVQNTDEGDITFAVTAVQQTGDLYFHLEAPAKNSWISVGTGNVMRYGLMWMIFKNANGTGVTFSSRTVDSHSEPIYKPSVLCQLNNETATTSNGIVNRNGTQIFSVNAVCRGINNRAVNSLKTRSLSDPSHSIHRRKNNKNTGVGMLNFTNPAQPFMFALGPTDRKLQSDSPSAPIRRHSLYGTFTLDLNAATVQSANDVDQAALSTVGGWQLQGARLAGGPTHDLDWALIIHVILLCGSFVLLFPTGVIFLRVLERVRWHAYIQGAGALLIVIGVGLGLQVSGEYVHSQPTTSAHQIIGLIAGILTITQFALGLRHHIVFKRTLTPTVMGRIHRYLGPLVLAVGIFNGFLGFNFSGAGSHNIPYGIGSALVVCTLVGLLFWDWKRKTARDGADAAIKMRRVSFDATNAQDPRATV